MTATLTTKLAEKLESAIWNSTLRSFFKPERFWEHAKLRSRYCHKVLSVAYNLRHPKNPNAPLLRASLLDGSLPPKKMVHMSPYEMYPSLWEPVFEAAAYKQLRRQLTLDISQVPEGQFTCSKCKSRKTSFYEVQTRSADEGMTLFIACLSCGKRWKS